MFIPDLELIQDQNDRDLLYYLFMSGIHHEGNPLVNIVVSSKHSIAETLLLQDKSRMAYNQFDDIAAFADVSNTDYYVFTKSVVANAKDICNFKHGQKLFKRMWGRPVTSIQMWAGKYALVHFLNLFVFFWWGALRAGEGWSHNPFITHYFALSTIFSALYMILTGVVAIGYVFYSMIGYRSWGRDIMPRHRPFYVRMIFGTLLTILTSVLVHPLGFWILIKQGP